jgi:hypothetical protein
MALRYGFGLHHLYGDRSIWEEKFKALTEDQKDFYHGSLAWLLMGWSISHISEQTIEEAIHRELDFHWHMIEWEKVPDEQKKDRKDREKFIRDSLTPFIGYQTNVSFETITDWIARYVRRGKDASLFKSEKAIDKEYDAFENWLKTQEKDYQKEHPKTAEPQAQEQQQ